MAPITTSTADGSDNNNNDIKTMKLYTNVERIKNELASRNMLGDDAIAIDPIVLSEIDSMHYMGNSAVEDAVSALKLDSSSKVLDIGSGFGGPARVLAAKSNCSVTALELQRDIHDMGEYLTKRCDLGNRVKHELGDILSLDLHKLGNGPAFFDGIVSFLVFLHIQDKQSLLERCAQMLTSGGVLYVEDFYSAHPFSQTEVESLSKDVYAQQLPTREEYIAHLEASGFHNIQFIDKSLEWTQYVTERTETFIANRSNFEKVHGEPTYLSLLHFYRAMTTLFSGKNLGGVRILAEKK